MKPFNPLQKQNRLNFVFWIDVFAERYGWTINEILELPLTTFFALQEEIVKKKEKENKK